MKKFEDRLFDFEGFYDSLWSNSYEEEIYDDEDKIPFKEFMQRVAKKYTYWFEKTLNEALVTDIKVKFDHLDSPRYYNYRTDQIWVEVEISDEDMETLLEFVKEDMDGFLRYISNWNWVKKDFTEGKYTLEDDLQTLMMGFVIQEELGQSLGFEYHDSILEYAMY